MMEEKMKRMRRARRKHSRWKRLRELLVATDRAARHKTDDDAAAQKVKDAATALRRDNYNEAQVQAHTAAAKAERDLNAAAAKKVEDDAAANKAADDEGDAGKGASGDEKGEDASMKPVVNKALKAKKKKKLPNSDARRVYQSDWQRQRREVKRQSMPPAIMRKAFNAKKVAAEAALMASRFG